MINILLNLISLIFHNLIAGALMTKILITFLLLFGFIVVNYSQTLERKDVPEKYKWNLADIYPTVEAWQADVDMLNSQSSRVRLAEVLKVFLMLYEFPTILLKPSGKPGYMQVT